MNAMDKDQLEKLIDDVSEIKLAMLKSQSQFRQLFKAKHFRLLHLLAGIAVILNSMVYFFLLQHYGSYAGIPGQTKKWVLGLLAIQWLIMGGLKWFLWKKSLNKENHKFTIAYALGQFFSFRIIHLYIPIMILSIFFCFFLTEKGLLFYIIPTVALGFGFLYNFLGCFMESKQYIVGGYWMILVGIGIIIADSISAPIAVGVSLGIGFLLMSIPIGED